jgi:2'-5' RNA ligase
MRRIFVAVDISDRARQRTADYISELRETRSLGGISWVNADKLHLTLRFIGNCNDDELEKVISSAQSVAQDSGPLTLSISGTGVFPNAKRPRVLWLGIGGEVDKIVKMVDLFNQAYGSAGEHDVFKPHLTIARVKDASKAREIIDKHGNKQIEPVEFEVTEIVVYESKLDPQGSVYSAVARYILC